MNYGATVGNGIFTARPFSDKSLDRSLRDVPKVLKIAESSMDVFEKYALVDEEILNGIPSSEESDAFFSNHNRIYQKVNYSLALNPDAPKEFSEKLQKSLSSELSKPLDMLKNSSPFLLDDGAELTRSTMFSGESSLTFVLNSTLSIGDKLLVPFIGYVERTTDGLKITPVTEYELVNGQVWKPKNDKLIPPFLMAQSTIQGKVGMGGVSTKGIKGKGPDWRRIVTFAILTGAIAISSIFGKDYAVQALNTLGGNRNDAGDAEHSPDLPVVPGSTEPPPDDDIPTFTQTVEMNEPEFTITVKPPTSEPTVTPTETGKADAEYQQMREELSQLGPLLKLLESPNGLKTNALIDYDTYEHRLLKKYIGYFLELACNKPELLKDLEFEPFFLHTPHQSSNLDINVQGCNITRETLVILEENGHTIILSHPIFPEGTDTSLTNLFPGINGEAFRFSADGKSDGGSFDSLENHSGMAFGSVNYPNSVLEMSKIDPSYVGFNFTYAIAKFGKGLSFSIPTNPDGTMVFSSVMIVPNGTSAAEIEKMVTKGTVAHFGFFSTKIFFTSGNFADN